MSTFDREKAREVLLTRAETPMEWMLDALEKCVIPDRTEANGWTVHAWEKWSNELAEMLPPEADGDEDQETLIARWVGAAATYGEQLEAVGEELDRWESGVHLNAYGIAHLERMREILEGERG